MDGSVPGEFPAAGPISEALLDQSISVDDSRLYMMTIKNVPTDDSVWSRPMPPGYAHEPLDVGTRSRPGLAVSVL